MKKRTLGRTGIEVSEVAFGGVEIGMPYANSRMPSESEAIRLLETAVDLGINFFDTARSYGRSEHIMGKVFKHRRSEVVISSKVANLFTNKGNLQHHQNLPGIIDRSLDESLNALGTDYIDIYMLHQVNREVLQSEVVIDKFRSLKNSGKIRSMGISTYKVDETDWGIDQGIWDVIQVPFNLMNQEHGILFRKVQEANLGMVIRSVLLRGMLNGNARDLHPALIEVENWCGRFTELIRDRRMDLPTLAMKFALTYDAVSSVLVGIDKMKYLYKAVRVADGGYLSCEFLKELEAMAYPDPKFLNLHEWDINGWSKN